MRTRRSVALAISVVAALVIFGLAGGARAADVSTLAETCTNCHDKDGASRVPEVPIIGGYSAPYLIDILTAYKNRARPCPETKYRAGARKGTTTDMCKTAGDMSSGDVKLVAAYFAGKKFVRAAQDADPALAQKGKSIHELNCEKCHSDGGSVASDDAGILAGQWMPYLKEQLKDFSAGKRPMGKKMKPKIEKLQESDFDALANFYGSFK